MMKYIIFLMVILYTACHQKYDRILEYDLSCQSIEVVSDLERSIENNKKYFAEQKIVLLEISTGNCGYILRNKLSSKTIKTAMTDIDLKTEINIFFELK